MEAPYCHFCSKTFSCNSTLNRHLKTSISCLEKREENINNSSCIYCLKNYTSESSLKRHLKSCKKKIDFDLLIDSNNELKLKLNKLEIENNAILKNYEILKEQFYKLQNKYDNLDEEYKDLIKSSSSSYQENLKSIENIATKAIENAGTKNTTINNKNQIVNNLIPLTNDYMKDQVQYFNIDYIKHGTQSLARFASDYTFKDRIAITDASRKKFIFKDENGNIISDFNGVKITDKFLETNKDVIQEQGKEYIKILKRKIEDYREREDWIVVSKYEGEYIKLNNLLNTILDKNNPDNVKNLEEVKNEFVINLIKMFDSIEKEEL